jgi:hypothetical protein
MSLWQKTVFIASWWWVGLVTFPRIVREAGKLFFLQQLHVWYRPEPLKNSIGRHAGATELALEPIFRSYLRHLVESAKSPFIIKYTAAGIHHDTDIMMLSDAAEDDPPAAEMLEFKVLTPIFYTRFVHYAHDFEALFSEFHESGTIWLSKPSLLPQLVLRKPQTPQSAPYWASYLYFKAIQKLRRRPPPTERPKAAGAPKKSDVGGGRKSDIRTFRLSAMDGYVLAEGTPTDQKIYRTHVLKLFLSDRVAFGSVDFLDAQIFLLRCIVLWVVSGGLNVFHL